MTDKLRYLISTNKIDSELKQSTYGTTGYRMNYKYLDGFMTRMSILAATRSIYKKKAVGIMITASHNPECDNGIKVIDPNGEMMTREWEQIAMEFVRWDENEFLLKFNEKISNMKISFNESYKGQVLIGYDTRSSSPALAELACSVLREMSTEYFVFEFVTTPQLHFFVKQFNDNLMKDNGKLMDHYFQRLVGGFCSGKQVNNRPAILNVDCANGVGADHILHLSKLIAGYLDLRLHNIEKDNLNYKCGADHVKICQLPPVIHNGDKTAISPGHRWCSIDGDVDRLIYFWISNSNDFNLLDGDKMAILMADFLSENLRTELESNQFSMAIIQTAYANSASTEYIENVLKIKTECVPTGVKYLHKAAKLYDVGIYFEANGHGTVLFSEKLRDYASTSHNTELKRFISIINDADGDAISDIIIIEHILSVRDWTLENWTQLYTDYPSRQIKVPVPDRNVIITTDAERRIETPHSLQIAIDKAVSDQLASGLSHSRAFVRPSGTEDVVRVYAESSNQSAADQLANTIALSVQNILSS